MTRLSLALLGPTQITLDHHAAAGFDYAKVRALLVYLAVERERSHQRDTIAELLWPEQEQQVARNSLRQALSKLRQAIRDTEAAPPFLRITRGTLQFNTESDFCLDIAEFEQFYAIGQYAANKKERVDAWEQAVAMYRGPFLDQSVPRDCTEFEEWALVLRERYERQVCAMLSGLAEYYEQSGEHVHALQYARRLLELDPWNEIIHRQVMRVLAESGQRGAALAQYVHCRRVLSEDLGVEPEAETTALYERLRAEASQPMAAEQSHRPAYVLPLQPTQFVGRESELSELGALLAEPACRLLTLLGPGGIGKTRLALRTAETYGAIFGQGACWVALAPLTHPGQVVGVVARALGVQIEENGDSRQQLIAALHDQELLLVLDNLEHLLEAVDLLVDILTGAPRVKLLVTSRERLQVQWEWLFDVRGLPYPTHSAQQHIASFSAVRLFLERVRQVRRDVALAPEDERAVVRICQVVEGMPLALELAATASREQSFAAVSAAIAGNLDILQSSFRDQPERHRSVRAAFEYSWRMLSAESQQAFMKLSVFQGAISIEGAAYVAEATPDLIHTLVDCSLLRREDSELFSIHELIRQFAAEKLASTSFQHDVYAKHLGYFVQRVETAEPQLRGSEQKRWLELLERDHDNVRAALSWAFDKGAHEQAARMAGALWRFWWLRGYTREGRDWLERVAACDGETLPLVVRAKATNGLGALIEEHGDFAQAAVCYQASLELSRASGDVVSIISALNNLGGAAYKQGNFERAAACFSEAVIAARAQGDLYATAVALHNLAGAIYDSGGDNARARELLEEALDIWQKIGLHYGIANSFSSLGHLAFIQRDYTASVRYFEQGLETLRELGDRRSISLSLTGLGRSQQRLGNRAASLTAYQEALILRYELGDKLGIAECFEGLGEVALAQGTPTRTLQLYAVAARLRVLSGSPVLPVDQADYEAMLSAARSQLSPQAAKRAWAEGDSLALEEAVALVQTLVSNGV
jgi:DNA-binding SARP family transcriptional activator/predicted ATPase